MAETRQHYGHDVVRSTLRRDIYSWQVCCLLKMPSCRKRLACFPQPAFVQVPAPAFSANQPGYLLSLLKEHPPLVVFKLQVLLSSLRDDNELVAPCYIALVGSIISYVLVTRKYLLPTVRLLEVFVRHPAFKHYIRVLKNCQQLVEKPFVRSLGSELFSFPRITLTERTYHWLKVLRLHKYWTPVVSHWSYQRMVTLDAYNFDDAVARVSDTQVTNGAKGKFLRSVAYLRNIKQKLLNIKQMYFLTHDFVLNNAQSLNGSKDGIDTLGNLLKTPFSDGLEDREDLARIFVDALATVFRQLLKGNHQDYKKFTEVTNRALTLDAFDWDQKQRILEMQMYAMDIDVLQTEVSIGVNGMKLLRSEKELYGSLVINNYSGIEKVWSSESNNVFLNLMNIDPNYSTERRATNMDEDQILRDLKILSHEMVNCVLED